MPEPFEEFSKLPPISIPPKPKKSAAQLIFKSTLIPVLVLRRVLLLADGRDKVMKVIQYGCKILLWKVYLSKSVEQDRLKAISNHFSLVRKVLRLARCLEGVNEAVQISKDWRFDSVSAKLAPLNVALSILNDISDDLICLSKLGVISKEWVDWCDPISARLWFITILIDIHGNFVDTAELIKRRNEERSNEMRIQLRQKIFMSNVSLFKLLADLVFCTVDVLAIGEKISPGYQHLSGFTAAVLGTYKLYVKHK
jgi:hypothetical protein